MKNTQKKEVLSREEQKARARSARVPRVTFALYRYVRIENPHDMRDQLFTVFSDLGCYGRIYIAHEGINAQMSVPEANWSKFDSFFQSIPEFTGIPYRPAVDQDTLSFYKLTIKVKQKLVADGLDDASFDVTNTGAYLTPEEMNEYIDDPNAVVVDMRNGYESEVGHFKGAITPDVDTFREELKIAPELLKVHKNKKIALYCTNGIRCEKASAWLKHNGFKDVRHLKGGVTEYTHIAHKKGLPNKFIGKNFVFDERLGERIGNEIIATCHLCAKEKCDTHHHCKNQACHILFIGCPSCIKQKRGYCSYSCMVFDALPRGLKKTLTKNAHKRKPAQFKKHRLRSASQKQHTQSFNK